MSSSLDHHDPYEKTVFGFWVYLLTDFVFFGVLFATYAVLKGGTYGGPSAQDLLDPSFGLIQSLLLLASSFACGVGAMMSYRRQKWQTLIWFSLTFFLGAVFLGRELVDFHRLIAAGNGWQRSAFLSAFFTLVGLHGLHLFFALLWTLVFLWPVCFHGIDSTSIRRLSCLKMFWQFVNVVWVFIFSIVYLMR